MTIGYQFLMNNQHIKIKRIQPNVYTWRQSSEVLMMRGHLELQASSNGWKYRSASITTPFPGTSGSVPDLMICVKIRNYSSTTYYLFDFVACLLLIFSVISYIKINLQVKYLTQRLFACFPQLCVLILFCFLVMQNFL